MKPKARSCALAAACVVALSPAVAGAQATDAAATALFDEGRSLMSQHRYSEACPKLAESQRLAPSGGTLLNLADCYEHTGQTASAWVAWKGVAARANAAGKEDMEKRALAKAATLEPSLARLTIVVPSGSDVPSLEVKRDGVVVGRAEYGLAIPVDPGSHIVDATAAKKKAWSATVDVTPKQQDARVTLSLVDDVSAAPPPPPAEPTPTPLPTPTQAPEEPQSHGGSAQKTLGFLTLGVGVAGVAVGSIFGVVAMQKNNDALQPQNCRTSTLCTQNGLSLTSDAKNAATLSTIAFVVGGVGLVGGGLLVLTAPSSHASSGARLVLTPQVAQSYGGMSLSGAW